MIGSLPGGRAQPQDDEKHETSTQPKIALHRKRTHTFTYHFLSLFCKLLLLSFVVHVFSSLESRYVMVWIVFLKACHS